VVTTDTDSELGSVAAEAALAGAGRGRVIWTPTAADRQQSTLTMFMTWLKQSRNLSFEGYDELWRWSTTDQAEFWEAIWHYFAVEADVPYNSVMEGAGFQNTQWFTGARLNFARMVMRHEKRLADHVAISAFHEDGSYARWTWSELGTAVRRVATGFRAMGIGPGDCVAAYLPNVVEAAIGFIAAAAVGAVWSSCSPEFGAGAATDRFAQIEPKLLIATSRYDYAGRLHDRSESVRELVKGLPTLEHLVLLQDDAQNLIDHGPLLRSWSSLAATPEPTYDDFTFEPVPSDHPLWVVYTSGTSGAPKAIVHTHVGALLGAMKDLTFHLEAREGSVLLFYATPSWIVWNTVLASLALGTHVVLYDGSPFHPDLGSLWSIAERAGATIMGVSPGFAGRMKDRAYNPAAQHDLQRLEALILSGAVAEAPLYEWLADVLPPHCRILSQAGSTEVCGGYAGGVRLLPIHAGESTARMLGMDVDSVDPEGRSLRGSAGELVISTPFPNAPRCLWKDPGGIRLAASYLSHFGGRWQQGDMIIIHSDGGCKILGRSDATINRHGVRMGTSEFYRALEDDPAITDAIAVFPQAGRYRDRLMLFVTLTDERVLDDDLLAAIAARISARLSPRHVPDDIFDAPAIPYTSNGKRMEVPLRHLLEGQIHAQHFGAALQHDRATADWFTAFAGEPAPASECHRQAAFSPPRR